MWRYLVGAVAALLLAGGGLLWMRSSAAADHGAGLVRQPGPAAAHAPDEAGTMPDPPTASEKTREQKRFDRYDKDRDGKVTRDEYLAQRRKAFARLDTDGDGRLSFDEWAIKAETKFATADADRTGALNAAEFATTRVVRKTRRPVGCPPAVPERRGEDEG